MRNSRSWWIAAVLAAVGTMGIFGCSTVETTGVGASAAAVDSHGRVQLRVQTGDDQTDALVYELAYQQFSSAMPLRKAPPYTGALEITFSSAGQSGVFGAPRTTVSGHGGWYTGGRATTPSTTGGPLFTWQNSRMLAVLKDAGGGQLWRADYNYRGGYELSGFVVRTPEQAARLILKRLGARYAHDARGAEPK